jgi:uncharacterized membrane protein
VRDFYDFDPITTPLTCLRVLAIALVLTSSILHPALAREPRRDPVSMRIRILYYGDAFGASPYPTYVVDPLTFIVALTGMGGRTQDEIDKKMRLYMPRSHADLVNKYDLIIMSDAVVRNFQSHYVQWIRDSVIEDGLALLMVGGYGSFGGVPYRDSNWGETVLQDALPVTCIPRGWDMGDQSVTQAGVLEIVNKEDEFATSLPFDEIGPYGVFHGVNIVSLKQTSNLIANYRKSAGKRYPLLVYEEIGKGSGFALCSDWTPYGGHVFIRWPYYPDFALNLASYVTGNPVPQDLESAHRARVLMQDYGGLLDTLHSVMDFVAKFGANIAQAEEMLLEIDSGQKAGKNAYMNADMDLAITELERVMDELLVASDLIWKLKDEALFWVYVTEWVVVAGTGMICGFVLWTIMVRRRLYREIETTRLSQISR